MLLKGQNRHLLLIISLIIFICILGYFHNALFSLPIPHVSNSQSIFSPAKTLNIASPVNVDGSKTHVEVYSVSTLERKYFPIKFGDHKGAMNANIIPHPSLNDTWIIVAQRPPSGLPQTVWFAELVCNAQFKNEVLQCVEPPAILPIAATSGDKCTGGKIDYYGMLVGPHDARVFYGPNNPYIIYGSNGVDTTCLGQWMLDFRLLVDWGYEGFDATKFRKPTELHRPDKYGAVEKNWFAFWDKDGNVYAHYDIGPKRVFAKLNYDGTVGPDLAPQAAATDEKCLAARMPDSSKELEYVHQATNSLAITMCKRADPSCEATESNTFIFTLFQHKSYYQYHSVYEPYVMMFRQTPPFDLHAISKRPIWIHGRGGAGMGRKHKHFKEGDKWEQTEMVYVTSLSWKERGLKYHGHIDDVLFIGFGIGKSVV